MWVLMKAYAWEYAFFVGVAVIFGCIPYAQTIYELGSEWLLSSPTAYITATYYSDRIHEVVDGHPLIGNPYFIEYRDEFPPAFFVADWLGAIPLFLRIPIVPALLTNIVVWSLALFVIAHATLVTLGVNTRVAAVGAVLLGVQVYAQMVQAVSMQIVYPFFLLFLYAYLLWLEKPNDRVRQISFAIATALCAYIYTYSIQIVAVLFALTGAWIILREREFLLSYVRTSVIGVVLCLPLIAFSILQIQHEHYFESLARIGLIHTHIPVTLAFFVACIPLSFLVLGFFIAGRDMFFAKKFSPSVFFLATTGLSLVLVMFSNVITGTDLELPQHIERFIVPWLMFATLFAVTKYSTRIGELLLQFPKNIVVASCVLIIVYSHVLHIKNAGPQNAIRETRTVATMERVQGLDIPLQWLRENVRESSVVWADPDGPLNNLIPTFTQHYILFDPKGALQLLPDSELEERYLLAHYFRLDKSELIREYVQYAGTGNGVHAHKTHNKRVKLCRLLRLDTLFERECGEEKDVVSYKGEEYFEQLLSQYSTRIQNELGTHLKKYSIGYIVADKETDSSSFMKAEIPGATRVFFDGRFSIYAYKL